MVTDDTEVRPAAVEEWPAGWRWMMAVLLALVEAAVFCWLVVLDIVLLLDVRVVVVVGVDSWRWASVAAGSFGNR